MRVRRYLAEQIYARPEVVARLKFLTNGGWGRGETGSAFLEILDTRQHNCEFFLAWEKGEIVGWALLQEWKPYFGFPGEGSKFQIGCYVQRAQRGKGIGTRLLEAAKKHHGPIVNGNLRGAPWNEAGHALFRRVGIPTVEYWV